MTVKPETPPTSAGPLPGTTRQLAVFWGLLLGLFLSTLDQSIVAAALPSVVDDLGGLGQFAWVIAGYGLALSVMTPLCGRLGDLFGHKRIFLTAVLVFLAGSALCGAASSMPILIIFRVVQGIGAGGLVVSVFSLIGQLFGPAERAKYQSYTTIVFAVASLAGPLAGGVITDLLGWRWTFYVNLPIGAVALLVVGLLLQEKRNEAHLRIDCTGAVLIAGTAVCLGLLASWVGTRYSWTSPTIVALAIGAAVLLVLWVFAEKRAAEPMIPLSLFRNRTFNIANTVTFLAGFAILATVNFLPLFLQAGSGATASVAGVLLIPMMLGLVVASILAGKRIAKRGTYKWYPVVSMAVAALAAFLLSTMTAQTSWLLISLYSTLLGIGSGLSLTVFVVVVQSTAPPNQIGAATGTVTFARLIGASFGVSVFGAIFASRLAVELPRHVPASELGTLDVANVTARSLDALPAALRYGFVDAYASSLGTVFLSAVPVLLIAFFLSLWMPNRKLGTKSGKEVSK